jgi:hypothetical protein
MAVYAEIVAKINALTSTCFADKSIKRYEIFYMMPKYTIYCYIFLQQKVVYSVSIERVYLLNVLCTVKVHVYWALTPC